MSASYDDLNAESRSALLRSRRQILLMTAAWFAVLAALARFVL